MKLESVLIINFRSIKKFNLSFGNRCIPLIGKNESGKSNVLRAISLINTEVNFSRDDIRQQIKGEDLIEEAYIAFYIAFNGSEIEEIIDELSNKILSCDLNKPALTLGDMEINLREYWKTKNKGVYRVDLIENNRHGRYFPSTDERFSVLTNWKVPKKGTKFQIEVNGEKKPIKEYSLINIDEFPEVPVEHLDNATFDVIDRIMGSEICQQIVKRVVKQRTIFWRFEEQYILPSKINIKNFSSNPESCIPLKSMFELAGYNNIKKVIEISQKTKIGLRNLLQRVSEGTTSLFTKVWKEYNSIKFELVPNGDFIEVSIKDIFNHFELSQRSEGFKRLVSFMLLISTKVELDLMNNFIILLDEPDLGLHPSSIKFLREELNKISILNCVIYSTHSIFMIDNKNTDNNFIVKKQNEITSVESCSYVNLFDEEVVFNSIGYSMFENLKKYNIIFEGWKDKKLFQVALSKIPNKFKELKKLKDIGLCHVKGVKDVKNIIPLLELGEREYIILTDGDQPAKERQSEFNELKYNGVWKRYDELLSNDIVTSEDFIKAKVFIRKLKTLKKSYSNLPIYNENEFYIPSGKLDKLEKLLEIIEPEKKERKKIINNFKNLLFEDLKQTDIELYYYEMLLNLMDYNFQYISA